MKFSKEIIYMAHKNNLKHIATISFVFAVALAVSGTTYFMTGIPLKYNLSSDTLVHSVHWQEFSKNYSGNFANDEMFQNNQAWPTGQLFIDKVLVSIGEKLGISLLSWSLIISFLTLAFFLGGVYFLVLYSLKNPILGLVISLVSIVPVISLGLSSWGFIAHGFVPKEIAVAITVWLSVLYFSGVLSESKPKIAAFFFLLGLFSNWYPIVFFHYALLILTVEIIRMRSIKKEHILYGLLFLAAAPVALYDLFIKSAGFSTPDIEMIYNHYTWVLHSWEYLFVHYLRKQIIYAVIIAALWYIYRRILKKEYPHSVLLWYAIWWSALAWSLIGVGIELFAPSYMKYLLSRLSVWFYFASMVIIAYTGYEIYFSKFNRSVKNIILFSLLLVVLLLGQTSLYSAYGGIKNFQKNAQDYKQYLSVLTELKDVVPPGSIILSNPDKRASMIRAYGGYGVYVSWKDGNIALADGDAAKKWFERYKETAAIFSQKDFFTIKKFAVERSLQFYLFDKRDIKNGADDLKKTTILEYGESGLVKLY